MNIAQDRGQLGATAERPDAKMRYRAETLIFEADWGNGDILLAGRPLVLVPIIAGPAMIFTQRRRRRSHRVDRLSRCQLDLTNAKGLRTNPLAKPAGRARSLVLRYLHRAAGMAEIASLLRTTPANATFHCQQLEAAVWWPDAGWDARSGRTNAAGRGCSVLGCSTAGRSPTSWPSPVRSVGSRLPWQGGFVLLASSPPRAARTGPGPALPPPPRPPAGRRGPGPASSYLAASRWTAGPLRRTPPSPHRPGPTSPVRRWPRPPARTGRRVAHLDPARCRGSVDRSAALLDHVGQLVGQGVCPRSRRVVASRWKTMFDPTV